jgi:phage tail sheath gpL-like
MGISYAEIPRTNRVPATYVEIDPSRALATQPGALHRVLLIGLMLADGTATPGAVVRLDGERGADPLFGAASQLAAMGYAFKSLNRSAEVWAVGVLEDAAGVAATSTLALAGLATAQGTVTLRLGDARVSVPAPSGATPADLGTALAAAVNALPYAPVTAAAAAGTVTLTARHKGESGNGVTLEAELLPAGITATASQPADGATNPSLVAPLAALDDSLYDTIVSGISDAPNMLALELEMERRWGPLVKRPGHIIAARRGTLGVLNGFGTARNSPTSTVMGSGLSPTPPWVWAAQVGAREAERCDTQPNQPRNGLTLPLCEAPKASEQFDTYERNQLLYSGISTFKVDQSQKVMIERLITTYQKTSAGTLDATYLAIETRRTLALLYNDMIALGAQHESDLLGPDGTNVGPGVPMTTPKMMRGKILALYKTRERGGLVKETDAFSAELLVELDEVDKERINVQSTPRIVGGNVTQAHKLSFQL